MEKLVGNKELRKGSMTPDHWWRVEMVGRFAIAALFGFMPLASSAEGSIKDILGVYLP